MDSDLVNFVFGMFVASWKDRIIGFELVQVDGKL